VRFKVTCVDLDVLLWKAK